MIWQPNCQTFAGWFYFCSCISGIMEDRKGSVKVWQLYYQRGGCENQRCLNRKGETLRKTSILALDVRKFPMWKDRNFLCDSRGCPSEPLHQKWSNTGQHSSPEYKTESAHRWAWSSRAGFLGHLQEGQRAVLVAEGLALRSNLWGRGPYAGPATSTYL